MVLEFVLFDFNRLYVVSWDLKGVKQVCIDLNFFFDFDIEIGELFLELSEEEDFVINDRKYDSNLSVEDDFFLVLMKFRLGLLIIDLVVRFNVFEVIVFKFFIIWINYLYVCFGDLKIWFYRNVIIVNMLFNFKEKYLNIVIIIDVIEFRI